MSLVLGNMIMIWLGVVFPLLSLLGICCASWICEFMLLLLSRFSHLQLCATPYTAAHQAPPSLGLSRQEHWSGLPFPSPMHERESEVTQSCPTLCNPMDCSLPGSSVHGIFQATLLELGAIAFSTVGLYLSPNLEKICHLFKYCFGLILSLCSLRICLYMDLAAGSSFTFHWFSKFSFPIYLFILFHFGYLLTSPAPNNVQFPINHTMFFWFVFYIFIYLFISSQTL